MYSSDCESHEQKIEKICKLFELFVLDALVELMEYIVLTNEHIVPPPAKHRKEDPF